MDANIFGMKSNNQFRYSVPLHVRGVRRNSAISSVPPPEADTQKTPKATASPKGDHIVHWFRKGLRLHDNPSLREGLKQATTFRCIFIIDPWFAGSSNVGINKWRFLLECLEDLDNSLRKLNSRLFVIRGQPADSLPKLFKEWGTTILTFEEDPEPFGRIRDHNIMAMCREGGISVISRVSHTLYKLDKIIEKNGGRAPLTYHQFQALVANMVCPPPAEPTINASTLDGATTPIADDHDDRFSVPTLEELGFETEGICPPVWVGGESEALARLERHLERKAWVASFGRPKMTPQSLLASQTGLSPYLRFGCLSTRLFYYQLTELYKRVKRARPPLSLHGQLLWREFFYCAATRNPNFDRMLGNPICVQIPWEKNQKALAKWANGQTGFPWIDAIMTQLREEGWIHHLARHAVACFLTRGDLWISWEEGMKVFDELLLDADWSVNAGMWMWLSCSSFFQQFFHCYCPVRFGRKADPNGDYIRKYLPILKNMPTQYIHEPWMAPVSIQIAAKCEIGKDYPVPIVDHTEASKVNIERIKQVYQQLAKYRPQSNEDTSKGGSLVVPLAVQNAQRPNMAVSSPSPTTIITNINQSNYLCNTTLEPVPIPQTFHNICKPMTSGDYENCNPDIFQQKEGHNNPHLRLGGVPFKRVIIVPQQSFNEEKDGEENQKDNRTTQSYEDTSKCTEQKDTHYYSEHQSDTYNNKSNIIMNYESNTNPQQPIAKPQDCKPQKDDLLDSHPNICEKYYYESTSHIKPDIENYDKQQKINNTYTQQVPYEQLNSSSHELDSDMRHVTEMALNDYKQSHSLEESSMLGESKQSPMDCNEHIRTNQDILDHVKVENNIGIQECTQPDSYVPD